MELGQAIGADVIDHAQQESLPTQQSSSTDTGLSAESEVIQQLPEGLNVFGVSVPTSTSSEHVKWRQCQLGNLLRSTKGQLSEEHHLLLKALLSKYHDVFSLEEDERGETDMIEFEINTENELPRKQVARRLPYAAHQEVADQFHSPWSSPVVLVRKRDGILLFCVDYRILNSVTKPDVLPLPRINDLLDQLGKSKHYST